MSEQFDIVAQASVHGFDVFSIGDAASVHQHPLVNFALGFHGVPGERRRLAHRVLSCCRGASERLSVRRQLLEILLDTL